MMQPKGKKLYPFVLEPIFKERIWGGRKLETLLSKKLPAGGPIGESWEISCRGEDNSVIRNGPLAGKTLRDVMETHPEELLGEEIKKGLKPPRLQEGLRPRPLRGFPLLNKFIDANELLSVQAHPDEQGARAAGSFGFPGAEAKTEAWYILHAEPRATLVKGLAPGTTRAKFEEAIRRNEVPSALNIFPVYSGDTVFVPAGCVHAMGAGLVVCEIQENSDTTFRVYDWGRVGADGKPRQLHIEQALEVINFADDSPDKTSPVEIVEGRNRRKILVACRYFAAELLELEAPSQETTGARRFDTYMVTQGAAIIKSNFADVRISAGDSALIPASVGNYSLNPAGKCTIIKVYVPDVERDVRARLRAAGIAEERIRKVVFP